MNRNTWAIPEVFRPVDLTPTASVYLDIFRSLAAAEVFADHWRSFILVDYWHIAPQLRTVPVKALYFVSGFGHQAVMVFFVLSGLLIASTILRDMSQGLWSWRKYFADRAARLYVVLIPALILGGVWDYLGLRFLSGTGIFSETRQAFSLSGFLGTLFFLETRLTSVFGSNGVVWSLFDEFWFYVLFPLLICIAVILSGRKGLAQFVGYTSAAATATWVLLPQLNGFAIWLLGAAISLSARCITFGKEVRQARRRLIIYSALTGSSLALCLLRARMGPGGGAGFGFCCRH